MKYYLENTCIEWLRKYVSYGKDVLERREPHSLRYFYTGVSDPSPGVPQFMSVGYVDGHLLDHYDSETQRDEPGADWFAANTDQQYWDRETETLRGAEQIFRVGLNTLRERYNQSRGSHTVQVMFGCDLLEDGSTRGFRQDAYEGRDFIAFDKDTLTFTAADAGAQITKRKWEQEGTVAEGWKQYLENTCIEWLRKYVSYGKDVLERREPHSLRYFYTAVSDPNPGVPQFVAMGSVDGEVFVYYDSETRRKEPRVDWIAANTDQQYWDRETEISQGNEKFFRVNLDTLQERYNQSSGSHTVQHMFGCDLLEDGSIRGFDQYGYEGRDFIALDKDALTFTAVDAAAQITKRKWEEDGTVAERRKYYLENTCIEWLRKYMSYGKDVLERRERPEVRVSGMEVDKILTLSCRAHGFYPQPISISWLKDGMVQEQETQRGSTVPNSDGTYHAWASIDVLPGDRDKYQCRVEHASLPQPGLFSWELQSNLIPIVVGVAVAVVAVIAALAGFAVWKKGKGYNVAPGSDGGSNSSNAGSNPSV
ncbi:class I histocompatibility antigen, F10 alpha chain-like isoform X8 [Aythya fuligula]|uniref:Class I histocompatibility antigen, F10 alpha chain-like isoform X8 n=1 Tax=Aythya fuligula TaxID=219594 RepID=A0A6J3EGA1_AYTFU|nr:class I histocompatibility antigen, F10 alpha chain-like isoform X8 [Aythya fuligula]